MDTTVHGARQRAATRAASKRGMRAVPWVGGGDCVIGPSASGCPAGPQGAGTLAEGAGTGKGNCRSRLCGRWLAGPQAAESQFPDPGTVASRIGRTGLIGNLAARGSPSWYGGAPTILALGYLVLGNEPGAGSGLTPVVVGNPGL